MESLEGERLQEALKQQSIRIDNLSAQLDELKIDTEKRLAELAEALLSLNKTTVSLGVRMSKWRAFLIGEMFGEFVASAAFYFTNHLPSLLKMVIP